MKAILELVTCVFLGWVILSGFSDYERDNYVVAAAESVYQLTAAEGAGSGVMIAPGRMLTVAHAVPEDLDTLSVMVDGLAQPVLAVEYVDRQIDIAILSVALDCPCAALAHQEPYFLDDVLAIGFPTGISLRVVTEGKFQGHHGTWHTITTAPAAPGSSGGGVFSIQNGQARLTGVTVWLRPQQIRYGLFQGPPAFVPVYWMHGAVNLEQIKQAILCADGHTGSGCKDPGVS